MDEAGAWRDAAASMVIPYDEQRGVHPQSEGFTEETDRFDAMVNTIDTTLHCGVGADETQGSVSSLYERIVARLAVRSSGHALKLLDWIREMVDAPALRVEGARQYATVAKRQIEELRERLMLNANELRQAARALAVEARAANAGYGERSGLAAWSGRRGLQGRFREALHNYAAIRLKEALHMAVARQLRLIEADLTTLISQLDYLSRNLVLLRDRFQEADEPAPYCEDTGSAAEAAAARYRQTLVEQLNSNRDDLARRVQAAVDRRLYCVGRSLKTFLEPDSELWQSLGGPLIQSSRRAVVDYLKAILRKLMASNDESSDSNSNIVKVILEELAANAEADREQAAKRQSGKRPRPSAESLTRVLIVPTEIDALALRQRLGGDSEDVTIVNGNTCDVALCAVRRNVPLDQFADEIIGGIPLFKDLANRLHTRIDVPWQPLADEQPEIPPRPPENEATNTAIIALPELS